MNILRWTFNILTVCGCWKPHCWSPWKKQLYNIYTVFVFFFVYTFTLSQLMDIILTVDNPDDSTDTLYLLISMMTSCCKISSIIASRNSIYILCKTLVKEPCKPMDSKEWGIQAKFEAITKSNVTYYTILSVSAVTCFILTSLFTDFSKKELIFRAWIPYNYSSSYLFYLMYIHQAISIAFGALINVACDSLICGLFVYICSQMEILQYRLNKVTKEKGKGLRNCIYHHNHIYRLAFMLNEQFKLTVSVQFLSSMLVVCFNLYQFTEPKSFGTKIELILYMGCTLFEIFFFCWYGNEVKIKSQEIAERIFTTDWPSLNNDDKKALLMIMGYATIPIEFTSAYIISVNLDSFLTLLKTSYSVYNLLRQTQMPQ